jgi:hypothetical protein
MGSAGAYAAGNAGTRRLLAFSKNCAIGGFRMKRWTIKELAKTDDITFAMCILSERREALNQEAPLAKKLKSAYCTLRDLRDLTELKFHD